MPTVDTIELDDLTQLPSRKGWFSAAQASLDCADSASVTSAKAVLFIDLDRFKWVNDSLGHEAGDQLLKRVARLIESALTQGQASTSLDERFDIPGRLGGDEFVVLLQAPESIANLHSVAARIVELLSQPIELVSANLTNAVKTGPVEVEIGASIGIASYPQDATDLEGLLKFADLAMYRAKHSGRNQVVVYKPEMMRQIERRRSIQAALRHALKDGSLSLDYVPVYDSRTQTIDSVEAKLNVGQVAQLESLDCGELFAIADASQVAIYLSEWMIQTALGFNQRLGQSGIEVPFVIEVRPSHFHQKGFVNWLADQLEAYEVAPELLILSLNEACLNTQRFAVASQLSSLSKLGIEISVQGFGSGNWSLLRLHDWSIDRLQLSAQLVQEVTHSRSMESMTGALIQLGQTLNKKVIAYGVRSAEQLAFLNSHRCFLMQGDFLNIEVSEEVLEQLLLQSLVGESEQGSPYYSTFPEPDKLDDCLDYDFDERKD
ncbi:MAG: EAL domain-containing protein [Gammaproteobacteria bacterium]|nr:EAL domain-containing protein [Gammaproteobacteria bacterium]